MGWREIDKAEAVPGGKGGRPDDKTGRRTVPDVWA